MKTHYKIYIYSRISNYMQVRRHIYGTVFLILALQFLALLSFGQTVITNSTPGTYTFIVPCGVTSITVECWGAGGSGNGNTGSHYTRGGGGGGAYASKQINVSEGTSYNYTVGIGGIGTTGIGIAGQISGFQEIVVASGGAGGYGSLGGLGGLEIDCIGDIIFRGGNGFNEGGGGSSAGPFSIGNDGTSGPGGAAVFDGGAGGACGGTGGPGAPGEVPGGGGGGAGPQSFYHPDQNGGAGGNGQIRITYFVSVEVCNGIDDDCNGSIDDGLATENYYPDSDGDGYGNLFATPVSSCSPVAGFVTNTADCDDTNPSIHMFAEEICNGIDDNCNTLTDEDLPSENYYADSDGDGYGNMYATPVSSCSPVAGLVTNTADCDDTNPSIHMYAAEICNGIDDNCNTLTDEDLPSENYYVDSDGDGYGNLFATPVSSCSPLAGFVTNTADCDDTNPAIHMYAGEICNGIDDNCNILIDDDVPFENYYADSDGDGYGNMFATPVSSCSPLAGLVTNTADCDDTNPAIHMYAEEICNGIDDNCNTLNDEDVPLTNYYQDNDGDGYGDIHTAPVSSCSPVDGLVITAGDCDDANPAIHEFAEEICNSIDDNCNGSIDEGFAFIMYYYDNDLDGYGSTSITDPINSCSPVVGYVSNNSDCDDINFLINPSGIEICNSLDDNCDGSIDEGLAFTMYYFDGDVDGYGGTILTPINSCAPVAGYVVNNSDCDDLNMLINPTEIEICNNLDDNCDGSIDEGLAFIMYYFDNDGDGYGGTILEPINSCAPVAGYVEYNYDCNDVNELINPAAPEICNYIDDNCTGSVDEGLAPGTYYWVYDDQDSDGFGAIGDPGSYACEVLPGYSESNSDCNDINNNIYPGAAEICNGIDDDCDVAVDEGIAVAFWYVDADGDGYGDATTTAISSCSALTGYVTNNEDCNDAAETIHPWAFETCNGIDDDCDGDADDGFSFVAWYFDADNDNYGDATVSVVTCSGAPEGYVANDADCNDADENINPAATEICNGVDDNCNVTIDEGFQDYDGDTVKDCLDPDDDNDGDPDVSDCQPLNPAIHTGASEICNTMDDDCDALIDEGVEHIYYADADGDLYGDPDSTTVSAFTCDGGPVGFVPNNLDCNDADENINPEATELCNGVDENCNGYADDGFVNFDGDLLADCADPDDDNDGVADELDNCPLAVNPAQQNFDLDPYGDVCDTDDDNDGDPDDTDCEPFNASVYTGAIEICNSVDDDCNGSIDDGLLFENYYTDNDGDGYGNLLELPVSSCLPLEGFVTNTADCDDANPAIHLFADEICNEIDDNCNTLTDEGLTYINYFPDNDGDGYGDLFATPVISCSPIADLVTNTADCDDANPDIHEFALEICNSIDDNCDGSIDEELEFIYYYADGDADGYGNTLAVPVNSCTPVAGAVVNNADCDDSNSEINPGATEICNGVDDDCDAATDEGLILTTWYADADSDGYGNAAVSASTCDGAPSGYIEDASDCNDGNAAINPFASEICNSIDDNCDGNSDDGLIIAVITAGGPTTFCQGENVLLYANTGEGYTYQWKNAGVNIAGANNSTLKVTKTASITVLITTSGGCFDESDPVAVTKLASPVSNVINVDATNDLCFDPSIKLKANIKSGVTYQWWKGGSILAGATSSVYSATTPGKYRIQQTSTATGCNSVSDPYTIIKTCREGDPVNMDVIENAISIYPNPAENEFTIDITIATNENEAWIGLYNMMGELVYTETAAIENGSISEHITLSDAIASGLYIVKVTAGPTELVKQILIQK